MLGRILSLALGSERDSRREAVRVHEFSGQHEKLEVRYMLSNIVWTNRGGVIDSDGFTAQYGGNAQTARSLVDRAIDNWEAVIENFNYVGPFGGINQPIAPNTYALTVNAAPIAGRGVTQFALGSVDAQGKPFTSTITMDDNAAGAGWFFDATPADDAEFTTLLSAYTADGAGSMNDFYRTIVHEIGHSMGLARGGPVSALLAIRNFETNIGADPLGGTLFQFNGASVTATLTSSGGRHIFEGAGGAPAQATANPNELMNAGRTVGAVNRRQLISDLTAQIVADAYGYTINLPSQINTFYANFNSTTGALTVNGGAGSSNDNIVIDNNGSLRVLVNGTEETFNGFNVTSINIDAGAGNDSISVAPDVTIVTTIDPGTGDDIVNTGGGSTFVLSVAGDGNDIIDFSNNPIGVSFVAQGFDRVTGTAFNDFFTVDVSGGLFGAGTLYFDGAGGVDTIQTINGTVQTETFVVGATEGSGSHTLFDGASTQTILFDNLEPFFTNVMAASLNINGGTIGSILNAANAINYTVSSVFGAAWGEVSIDAFEPIHFTNKAALNIDGEAGADQFSLNNPNLPTGLTSIVIDGGDPTNGDELQVNGVPGVNDDIQYAPTAAGAGTITNPTAATFATVMFSNIEQVVVAGQAADNDGLRVNTTAASDNRFWTAGATFDRGFISGDNGVFAITPVRYSQITDYVIPLSQFSAGMDTLTINGTDADDTFDLNDRIFPLFAAAFPSIVVNGSAPIFFNQNTNLIKMRGLSGNDTFNVTLPSANIHTFGIEGGDSDQFSDTLNLFAAPGLTETVLIEPGTVANHQDITGLNSPIDSSGVELITFSGENNDDTLIAELEDGFKTAQLSDGPDGNGPAYDQLVSDTLPLIRYRDLLLFEVDNDDLGEITIITDDLNEAATILVDGDGDETLIVQGQDAQGDDYTISLDGSGNVQIVDNNEGVAITTTGIDGPNDHLFMNTRGDDDLVSIDVNGTDLIDVLITYDGGGGSDVLTITGAPSVTVDSVTYRPGPAVGDGRLFYDSTGRDMTIDFTNLEPINDAVVAAALTVDGTNADNGISYLADPNNANQGQVAIDGFEVINFVNKTALNLNGQGGSDQITINNPNVPTGLTDINVDGGPGANDRLTVIGTPANDNFTLVSGALTFNTLNVSFAGVDSMLVAGRAGNDTFQVLATSLPVWLSGNSGMDSFFGPFAGNLDGLINTLTINGGSQTNTLSFDDFLGGSPSNVDVTASSIIGLAPSIIRYAATGGRFDMQVGGTQNFGDQIVVRSLLAENTLTVTGFAGNDRLVVKSAALGDVTLNGNDGDDLLRVEFAGAGSRTVDVDGGNDTDNLAVFATNDDNQLEVTAADVTGGGQAVNFNAVEFLQVHGLGGDDTFDVVATAIPLVLNGQAGNDTFNITSAFPSGNLNAINAPVKVIGGADANALNVSDQMGGPNNNVVVTANQISGFAPVNINYVSTDGIFAITLIGSSNFDNFDIVSLSGFNTLTILGGDANDNFNLGAGALGNVTLSGNSGDDTFTVALVGFGNRQVTINGGSGDNTLTVNGTTKKDVLRLTDPRVSRAGEDVIYSAVNRLNVNALGDHDVIHVNTAAPTTVIDAGIGNDYLAVHHMSGVDRLVLNAGGGNDEVLIKKTDVGTRTNVNGQQGRDNINIGSNDIVNFGNLTRISGRVTVTGGADLDRLYINDRAAIGQYDYQVTPIWVVNSPSGIARPNFAGINYTSGIETLRLDGTDQRNEFVVWPSFNTRYVIDGNLPSRNQVNAASEGDFLNLNTLPNDGHRLSLTDRDTGTGNWVFTNGHRRVDFTQIEQFNHVERLAIGSDIHVKNRVKVRDAESRIHLFDIQPYEAHFTGGVRVATGDINGDGIPDIITAPGHGRAPTVKVFDGWDGTEIQSFDAYGPHMTDGLFVAAGNINHHAAIDIVTAAGPGGKNSEVRVFRNTNHGQTFTNAFSFLPYGSHATAGASVAVGNVNNDAYDDIITAPLHGKVQIVVFAGKAGTQGLTELARFRAFTDEFRGGAYVAAGNYLGGSEADIIVGAGHNSWSSQFSSQVLVFDGANLQNQPLNFIPADFSFAAYTNQNDQPRAAVRLVAKDHDLDGQVDELFTGQGPHGQSNEIRVFQPLSGTVVDTIFENFGGGVFLG